MRTALIVAATLAGVASGFVPRTKRVVPSASYAPRRPRAVAQPSRVASLEAASSPESTAEANGDVSSNSAPSDWRSQILSALSVVIDPDLDSDIVSLGFVQNLRIDDSRVVSLDLELTTPACPVKDLFVQQCQDAVNGLEWTRGADVTLTARPAETPTGAPLGMSQVGAVIAVSSCKGGVGKSTTAVNLAFALESLGARVGIFDADVYGPSLPTMVTPEDDDVRFVGRQIAPLRRGGVGLMSFGYVNEGSAVMRGPMVTQLLDQFLSLTNWGAIDYLIMDMPPGTGDIQLTLSQRLSITAAVIVTTPQELSFVDVERGVEMFDTVNVPCIAVVENMAYFEKEKDENDMQIDEPLLRKKFLEALRKDGVVGDLTEAAGVADELVKIVQDNVLKANKQLDGEKEEIRIFGPGHKRRLSEQWGIEHTYSVPLLGKIAQNGDSGTPFILDHPNSPQADIYRQLAKSVVSEVAKAKYGKGKGGGRPGVRYSPETHTIQVAEGGGTEEVGSDREESAILPAELRRACRCAECVEELTGKQILNPLSVPESIRPLSMSPTGNYALSVDWSDGHRSLYPYRQIRSMLDSQGDVINVESVEETKEEAVL
eukprot:CAMPEP_0172552838 /NCGR_PEP_ID=MMETSP1067-20121228/47220_1 /TAXON_ID=265564 ORGANISM="Thalassiosira punctigera, Strain Tpunct2005C2" /NCGR_SAMPLE_ID=MMETSP1067 /ASSEMBLY_ACC=CAM_ASM_000444 /LENGTH=599 /DNA_ID=CAMNT_0013340905 /DNA_START=28 /DNA_END=1827 /DNA_ORIENTATION=+